MNQESFYLNNILRDFVVGKMDKTIFLQQKSEILSALVKLGDTLTEDEQTFLDMNTNSSMKQFTNVQDTIVIKDGLVTKKK